MSDNQTLYRQIFKSASLFGGIQVFNIIISIVRSKAIALFIGPAGMGIAALLNATVSIIGGFTTLGLETSSVKYISELNAAQDRPNTMKVIAVLKKAVWVTGIAGAVVTLALSSLLSNLTFGNSDYAVAFAWLSLTMLFKQLTNGHLGVLQGLQKLKDLARANFFGNLAGLLVSLPLYYLFGIDAIVPAIVVTSIVVFLACWYYERKVENEPVKVPFRQLLSEGKSMLKLGFMLSITGLITTGVTYLIQIYISHEGSLAQVGLYNAGIMLLNTYVGIIFTSMATDYFPRLSAVCNDNPEVRKIMQHQALVAILILTPVIVIFLAFAPLIIKILFSERFTDIEMMVRIGIAGMIFRAVSWSLGYTVLAKGDSKLFIKTAFGFNALFLILNVAGYFFYGLTGLGAAFLIHYFLHMVILYWITKRRYGMYLEKQFQLTLLSCILLCIFTFLAIFIEIAALRYFVLSIFVIIAVVASVIQLNKKIDFLQKIKKHYDS